MNNSILIIAHAPLANALRQCALHVFPDCGDGVAALDVQPNVSPEETFQAARISLEQARSRHVLVLTDVFGATPCNVAQRLVDGVRSRLVAGGNLPRLEEKMIKTTTTISNKLGLHARASAKLTKLAGSFPCDVWISRGERRVNAKSIMGVMMLAAGLGATVVLETSGAQEQEAMDALLALMNDKFGEGE